MLDSGVGGLAVARRFFELLPEEDLIYVGDTAFFPYGSKPAEQVMDRVRHLVGFLLRQEVKLVVLACNTASAVALPALAASFPLPLLGVIEAGAREAVRQSEGGRVGVLATEQTVRSGAYARAIQGLDPRIEVLSRPVPHLVEAVEAGLLEEDPALLDQMIYTAVQPLVAAGVDTIVLGCTHFLILKERVEGLFPELRQVIDPAAETAIEARQLLQEQDALYPARWPAKEPAGALRTFCATGGDIQHFTRVGQRVLGSAMLTLQIPTEWQAGSRSEPGRFGFPS